MNDASVGSGDGDTTRFLPGRHLIESYGNGGFRFGGMSHRGSVLLTPHAARAWHVAEARLLDEAAFAPVFDDPEPVELLLIGTGAQLVPLPAPLREALRARGLRIDVMPTSAATRTYNVLAAENRHVGAALIAVP
jgi:uncharacterized protein